MPTENGTPIDAARRPSRDATLVRRLRQAGAVIMGKTVTTELASMQPRGTRNPYDPARTPGGSSSGSAAAVAAGMVPLAIGTQTGGSVIRPASFCGVVGFKPTFGMIPRRGVLPQATPLDTIGVFARSVEDAALSSTRSPATIRRTPTRSCSRRRRCSTWRSASRRSRRRSPSSRRRSGSSAEPSTKEGFGELVEALGKACEEVALPQPYADAMAPYRARCSSSASRATTAPISTRARTSSATTCARLDRGRAEDQPRPTTCPRSTGRNRSPPGSSRSSTNTTPSSRRPRRARRRRSTRPAIRSSMRCGRCAACRR